MNWKMTIWMNSGEKISMRGSEEEKDNLKRLLQEAIEKKEVYFALRSDQEYLINCAFISTVLWDIQDE